MDIKNLLEELSLEEKVAILSGKDFWHTKGVERLGIPSITLTDGPHGVRLADDQAPEGSLESKPATSFPIEAAMASTWNEELLEEMGESMAEECQHYDVGVLLGPGVNGKRTPVAGRNFEYFSEDPYLSGKMGTSVIKGIQNKGIGTSVKHYVANEQETNRMVVSSEVDERTLREIYLLPFEMIIKDANPWTVMCSYNKVNGTYMSQNSKYLIDALRKEWGFNGLVMSDWGAVNDRVEAIKAGLDLEMPGPGNDQQVIEAVKNGDINIKEIDQRVSTVLKMVKKVVDNKKGNQNFSFEKNHDIAKRVAEEAIVLLKNENILPLEEGIKLAVLGDFAKEPRFQGGGSSHINPYKLETPLGEIKKFADVSFGQGYSSGELDNELIEESCQIATGKDAVVIFVGTTEIIESEGYDRKDLKIPESHLELIKEVAKVNSNIVVVTNSGAAIETRDFDESVKGLIHAWLPGQAGGSALANIIFGHVNPSGKLTETFPMYYENNPAYLNFPGNIEKVEYKEGIFVGYRYYDTKKIEVQYPFGYGLSYTEFEYSNLKLSKENMQNNEKLIVSFDIKNIGDYKGKEVAQLYISDKESTVVRPNKELKGFSKVNLKPGETKTVSLTLDERAFSFYLEMMGEFVVESGNFDIMIGSSSSDIRLQGVINFDSEVEVREDLTAEYSIETFLGDDRTAEIMKGLLSSIGMDESKLIYPIVLGLPLNKLLDMATGFGVPKEQLEGVYDKLGIS